MSEKPELTDQMRRFTILTTNDMHSSFTGSGGSDFDLESVDRIGGYSRLASAINLLRKHYESLGHQVLLLDSGDFYSGSLFQLLAPCTDVQWAPELEFFSLMKYDAITLGNHDFEAGEESLMGSFTKLQQLNLDLNVISSNLRVKKIDTTKTVIDEETAKQSIAKLIRQRVNDYIIVKKGDITFGIIGAMGPDAAFSCSSTRTYVGFIGYDERQNQKKTDIYTNFICDLAKKIRPSVDVLILLAHQGSPEDVNLAKELPTGLIDIMISGHTHETYFKKVKGKEHFFEKQKQKHQTFITQSQSHGKRLGVNTFYFKGSQLKHFQELKGSIAVTPRSGPRSKPQKQPPKNTPKGTPKNTPKSTPRSTSPEPRHVRENFTREEEDMLEGLLAQWKENRTFVDIDYSIKYDNVIDKRIEVWANDVNIAKKKNIKEKDSTFYDFKINQIVYKSPEQSSPHEGMIIQYNTTTDW